MSFNVKIIIKNIIKSVIKERKKVL